MGCIDQQAVEMVAYPMHEYMRWEREHHGGRGDGTVGPGAHTTPVEDCPICRWGCQVADCECADALSRR